MFFDFPFMIWWVNKPAPHFEMMSETEHPTLIATTELGPDIPIIKQTPTMGQV